MPHTVDANVKIDRVADVDDEGARVIYFEKNRFGPLNELECIISRTGYDFDAVIVREDEPTKVKSKKDRKSEDYEKIMNKLKEQNGGGLNISDIAKIMEGNAGKAYSRLRDLIISEKIEKTGRGANAGYMLSIEELRKHNTEKNNVVRFAAESK